MTHAERIEELQQALALLPTDAAACGRVLALLRHRRGIEPNVVAQALGWSLGKVQFAEGAGLLPPGELLGLLGLLEVSPMEVLLARALADYQSSGPGCLAPVLAEAERQLHRQLDQDGGDRS